MSADEIGARLLYKPVDLADDMIFHSFSFGNIFSLYDRFASFTFPFNGDRLLDPEI